MGVMGSYCQICGVPVQHDHYVPTEREDYFNIYRHSYPDGCAPKVPFGPQHQWLLEGVALARDEEDGEPVFGLVEDGHLTNQDDSDDTHFVADGRDDRIVVHRACWELAGKPNTEQPIGAISGLHDFVLLARYRGQLFDFERVVADGRMDLLEDPRGQGELAVRNRARIERILQKGQASLQSGIEPPTLASQLNSTDCWERYDFEGGFWRYRNNVTRDISPDGWDRCLFLNLPREDGPEGSHCVQWEAMEVHLIEALREQAIVLACQGNTEAWVYLVMAKQGVDLVPLVDPVLGEQDCHLQILDEPGWDYYREELHLQLSGRWDARLELLSSLIDSP